MQDAQPKTQKTVIIVLGAIIALFVANAVYNEVKQKNQSKQEHEELVSEIQGISVEESLPEENKTVAEEYLDALAEKAFNDGRIKVLTEIVNLATTEESKCQAININNQINLVNVDCLKKNNSPEDEISEDEEE